MRGVHVVCLYHEALNYFYRHGFTLLPIHNKNQTKYPAVLWKPLQTQRPDPRQLTRWFRDGKDLLPGVNTITGLAVLGGTASDDLVCRDFDTAQGYFDWAQKHAVLAHSLPTVKTRTGYHVIFRTAPQFLVFVEYGENDLYGKGEYRGSERQYWVLPPSEHPKGGYYEWHRPLGDEVPYLPDPRVVGLLVRDFPPYSLSPGSVCGTTHRPSTTLLPLGRHLQLSHAFPIPMRRFVLGVHAARALRNPHRHYVPTKERQRHRRLLAYARFLKRHWAYTGFDVEALFREWYCLALPNIRTKDYGINLREFIAALTNAPAVKFTPNIPNDGTRKDKLHHILWQSSQINEDGRGFIHQREAAEKLKCKFRRAQQLFAQLEREGKIFDKREGCNFTATCNSYQVREP
jgi:hypothetical protein